MFFFHCIAHKISLVSNDITSRFEYVQYFQSVIYELIKFFINSPKKIQILDDYQEELNYEILSLIRPIKIRWFSFFRAINRIIILWEPLFLALEQLSDSTFSARSLLKEFTEFKLIFFLHYFQDLYSNLDKFSKIFQNKTMDLFVTDKLITICKGELESSFFKKEELNNLPSVRTFFSEIDPSTQTYRSRKINFDHNLDSYFRFEYIDF